MKDKLNTQGNHHLINEKSLKDSVEALLFVSGDGLSPKDISEGMQKPTKKIREALDSLVKEYTERSGGIYIEQRGDKCRFKTSPSAFNDIRFFLKEKKKETLSKAMMEVLAMVAYKQPITQFEIDELRGVKSRSLITSLLYKKLVKSVGQKETPGRPTLYGTTKEFLMHFSLKSLKDLPEIRELKELNLEDIE